MSNIFNVRNMVFRIMPRLSYEAIRSARREMKLQLERKENPDAKWADKKTTEDMRIQSEKDAQLKKRKQKNVEQNVLYYESMKGRKVTYGSTIQLMHSDSGYFL